MSLENALAENTAAIQELTAATKELAALRTEAIGAVKAATAAAPAKSKPATKTDEKPTEPEAPTRTGKDCAELAAAYVAAGESEAERKARTAKVRELKASLKVHAGDKIPAFTDAGDIRTFYEGVQALIEAGDVTDADEDLGL